MRYLVQVSLAHHEYQTRCATDKWNQAVLNYNAINIGGRYTKRLVEVQEDGKFKVISRVKGS